MISVFVFAQTPVHNVSLSLWDWLALSLFILFVIGSAVWGKIQQAGSEDYYLAGRSMGWIVVAFSMFATLFSTISFVAIPGESYNHGLMLSLAIIPNMIVLPIGIWMFLRFFFMTPTFTAYEYLEARFNLSVRLIGASVFCLVRLLYVGTVFYAAALVFESLIGWPPLLTILVIGTFTIVYSATGGMKAVMLTDVVQGTVLLIGVIAIIIKILSLADFNVFHIYTYAQQHGHAFEDLATNEFYRLNFYERYNIWLWFIGFTVPLQYLSCDQLALQRLLASKSYRGAKRAVWANAILSFPILAMFWFVGIGLFYYYGSNPEKLPANMSSDHVLGHFIQSMLPAPVPGLIMAALLAALMSTIDSSINSLSNVVHRDFLLRLKLVRPNSSKELLLCRFLSITAGVLAVGVSLALTSSGEGIKTSILEIAGIWGSLWGVLLSAFVLGVLVPRVSGIAILCGMAIGGVLSLILPYMLYYRVPSEERISFMWVGVPGMLVAFVLPLLVCLFFPNRKQLTGLTHWTLTHEQRYFFSKAPKHKPSDSPV